MALRRLPKGRWSILAVAVLAASIWFWWLVTPEPLTAAEQQLVGTWERQGTTPISHLTFGTGHSATKVDYDNGPDAPPWVYYFTWRVQDGSLVVQHVPGSLIDRVGRGPGPPHVFGLVSVTPTAITLRYPDGSQAIMTRRTVPATATQVETRK
jgi:hypothetical protein